jgi:hypothetical protein
MSEAIQPLPLPEGFDPETNLIASVTENGVFHESRRGAALAYRLIANGAPQDLALAERVLDTVLRCQERRPEDPHYGNFYWMLEDDVVFDLNAVEFCLEHLIPLMIERRDRLSPAMQARVLEAIRLGLQEVERLDVHVQYTNIALFDILNSSLGGELLGDERIAQRGYRKLARWMAFTDQSGIPQEYNSPTYTAVGVRSLHALARLTRDEATRARARLMSARLGLSIGLHIHPATGRWAGPHSRAYQPTIACDTPPEIEMVRNWIAEGALPAWVADLLQAERDFQVHETASVALESDLITYQSDAFALGTASREAGGQSNAIMAHYARPGAAKPGVIYCRYLLDDKWLGDFYHATDRTKSRNLLDEGQFHGAQSGPGAIALYTVPNNLGVVRSAKAVVIVQGAAQVEEIWVGGQRISALPAEVPPGAVVVIASGAAHMAVLPLSRTDLGRNSPIRLVEINGDLALEIYNYLGTGKSFWEMRHPGAFYRGKPKCGFYLEMAARDEYPDGKSFGDVILSGQLRDESQPPYTYTQRGDERLWQVEYRRAGRKVGIAVDLMEWKVKRRWTEQGDLIAPMLESPLARQNRDGRVEVDGGVLECGRAPAWLFHSPVADRWVAGYHGQEPAPLRLTLPTGSVEIEALAESVVVWDAGEVTAQAVQMRGVPRVAGGRQ